MSKKIVSLLMCICLLVLSGCNVNQATTQENEKEDNSKLEIGMSFDSFVIERWLRDRDVFVATAKELGADVNVQTANGEVNEQIDQIEYFIDKGVDAIVIVAIDSESLADVVAKAKKAGIPVVCYDRVIRHSNADLFISFDNEKVGELMATSLFKEIGRNKKIVKILGPDTDYNVEMVGQGFDRIANNYRADVIGQVGCDGWKPELAYDYVSENMDTVSKADAIMCGNDSLAGEVIHALAERRLAGSIPVAGQDAELEACQRIVDGTQLMTVYKPVEKLAKTAAEYAVKLAKGESIGDTDTFNDGKYDIPYVALDPIEVNAENMDKVIIDSGFHMKEDVYINQ